MGAIAPVAPALKLHLQRVEEHSNIHERPDSILLPSFFEAIFTGELVLGPPELHTVTSLHILCKNTKVF